MIYLFVGTDDYLKSSGAKKIIDQLVPPEDRDFGLEVIDALCDRGEEVEEALNRTEEALYTDSFFGGGKVVWLRDANFLPGARGRAVESQQAKAAVERFCKSLQSSPLPDGHALIITASSCSKATTFGKWIHANGTVTDCGGELRSYQLEAAALERLKTVLPQSTLRMAPAVQTAFVQRVGADTRTLVSELEKLRTYIGQDGASVSRDDIEAVTSVTVATEPFELAGAIQERSATKIAKAVSLLSSDKNAAFPAAAIILNTLNDLCCIRDAVEQRLIVNNAWDIPGEQIPERLRRVNGWMLGKLVAAANRYTLNELRAARHYAVEMRFKLVDSTAQTPWSIIEPVLLRIVARRPGRP